MVVVSFHQRYLARAHVMMLFCILQESEFSRSTDISGYNLLTGAVFVLWNFGWYEGEGSDKSTTSEEVENDSEVGGDIDEDNTQPDILHTVTFKCIGSVHDANAYWLKCQQHETVDLFSKFN